MADSKQSYDHFQHASATPRELRAEVERLRGALQMLRDACGHCLATNRPPHPQMIENADRALRGEQCP